MENTPILLDGRRYFVTANLESFLRHRRDAQDPIDIWVDAVCINQSDVAEKNGQIKLMSLIYMAAAKVMVWLGKEADDSDLAMDELSDMGQGSPYNKLHIITGNSLTALNKLLSRSWWSRIWVVQEIFWGGAGIKLDKMRIRCGHKELEWITLVIAAAKMQSHKEDQRQHFPTLEKLFALETFRYQGGDMKDIPANERFVFDTVAQFRNFQATEPKDKIYALLGTTLDKNRQPFAGIEVDYSLSVVEVYRRFASMALRSSVGLNVLAYCRRRSIQSLPSWVPDWSNFCSENPLPLSRNARQVMVPWWMNPIPAIEDTKSGARRLFYRYKIAHSSQTNLRESGNTEHLPHGMMLNIIPKHLYELLPPDTIDTMQALIKDGALIIFSEEDDMESLALTGKYNDGKELGTEDKRMEGLRLITKAEHITRFRSQSKIVSQIAAVTGYRASDNVKATINTDELSNILTVDGVLYDKIAILLDPFVDEVAANWENATRLMVQIGIGKEVTVTNYNGPSPYSTEQYRTEAFWLALLAGQTTVPDHFGKPVDIQEAMQFQDWLPPIPPDWKPAQPPVTVVNSGRLEAAQSSVTFMPTAGELKDFFGYLDDSSPGELKTSMPGINMAPNLQPLEWTDEDREHYTRRFEDLGRLWEQQPFDLYHRPFALPTVVPDPYWDIRKSQPHLTVANIKFEKYMNKPVDNILPDDMEEKMRPWKEKKLSGMVPIVPINNLPAGFEKYTLGRRLAVTKRGYIGLVPKETKMGDHVSVLFGSEVPIILRKRQSSGFEVVGETYIHGIMEEEVIEKWKSGWVESGDITLH